MTNDIPVKSGQDSSQHKGMDISERLLEFAARVLKMADALSKSPAGRHISSQIIRSSTSGGAHYEEARGAESKKDFIHKLGICLKELRETRYWIRLIIRAELHPRSKMQPLLRESDELCRIIGKSIITAKTTKYVAASSAVVAGIGLAFAHFHFFP